MSAGRPPRSYCVFGAGAVGANLALSLGLAGADVSVVARGAQLRAIAADGITVSYRGQTRQARVRATDDAGSLTPQEVVIVALKAGAIEAAAPAIASLLGPETTVVFAVNGLPWWYRDRRGDPIACLDPDAAIARHIPRRHVAGGVIHVTATIAEPGHVHLEGVLNGLVIGEPDGPASARLEPIVAALQAGGVRASTTDSIGDAIWRKLAVNHASNPLTALAGAGLSSIFTHAELRDAAVRLIEEAGAIAAAEGYDAAVDPQLFLAHASQLSHKTSMLLDIEAGRPTERAAMLDAPLQLAARHGLATPTLALVTGLLRAREAAAHALSGPA